MQMRAQGKFYVDKVDLLVSYLIMQPLTGLWDAFAPERLKVRLKPWLCEQISHVEEGLELLQVQ